MSSCKIFKDNPDFTRISLVNEFTDKIAGKNKGDENRHQIDSDGCSLVSAVTDNETTVEAKSPTGNKQPPVDIKAIREEFYQLGKQEAEQTILNELHQAVDAFTCACTEINNLHKNLLEQSRGDTINLVMALCKKIVVRELRTDREAIARTLQKAIEISIDSSEYDIWLNPDDFSTVEKMTETFSKQIRDLKQIRLKTDPSISRGGCRLESTICRVDATIETQMESIREFLGEQLWSQESEDRDQKTKDINKKTENGESETQNVEPKT